MLPCPSDDGKVLCQSRSAKVQFGRRTQSGDQHDLPDPEQYSEFEAKHQTLPCRWLHDSQVYLLLSSKESNFSWVNDKCYCFFRAVLEEWGTIISNFFWS